MTLLTYQVFKTIADVGSFHKAADILGLTPSAISHAISSMENELGFSVLTRSKAGVSLTNYGEQLLPYVNAVLNCDESLKQEIAELNGLKQGKVKIGVFSSVCTSWLPEILHSFKKKYTEIDIEEMKHHQFVTQRDSTDADIQNFLKENSLQVQSNYHVVDDLSTIALVEKGFGICLMPKLVMTDIPYKVDSYPTKPPASRIIGLAAMNPNFMAPAVRTMFNHIVDKYQENEFKK